MRVKLDQSTATCSKIEEFTGGDGVLVNHSFAGLEPLARAKWSAS